ncbi:MAG: DsbA family protein [Anaerolineae bacterium]|nr:DsbA family protein [Anaerolineae bacterium]
MKIQPNPFPSEEAPPSRLAPLLGGFVAGLLVGAALVFAVMSATPRSAAVDPEIVRQAAREGAAQALREQQAAQSTAQAQPSNAKPFAPKIAVRAANAQGQESAPVLIVEYSDFECGFCRRFYEETFPRIVQDYVNTGKVRFVYKHFPVLRETSSLKAEAAECAADQGRFWEFHNALFSDRVPLGADRGVVEQALEQVARELNMNVEAFAACLKNGSTRARVAEDFGEAQEFGVRGTPSFLINGEPLVGAQPYIAFQRAIEKALAGR